MPLKVDDPFTTDRLNDIGDYRAEWDVAELGKQFTDAFSDAVDAVRHHPGLDPTRKVHAFLGPAGYGKTHLFGRIHHQQGERVHFVFISAITGLDGEDKAKQLESLLRWRVIEALLYSASSFAPFRLQLAKLLAPSFLSYFRSLGQAWREQVQDVQSRLEGSDPLTVLELFSPVEGVGPFHLLADAMQGKLPQCARTVLRALVLGASSAGTDCRCWLRGEADQIAPARLAELRLPEETPPLLDILVTVAELLRLNNVPLVLCFDQLDELFKHDRNGFTALTSQLMSWLQSVPNMLLGIGCLETSWDDIRLSAGLQSFAQRVTTHLLPALTGDRAVTLLEKRLASWSDADPKRGNGWPFDLASVKQFVDHARQSPRSFVQVECQPRFAQWLAGKRQDWIRMVDTPLPPAPVEVLFQAEWQKELEAVKAANKSAVDTSELELWAGVSEAFAIAKMGGYSTAGYRIEAIETNPPPIIPSGSDKRPSLRLKFAHAAGSATVLVAVSKKDSGVAFGAWQAALEQAMKASGGRAVVIWHRSELGVGKTAKAYRNYTQLVNDGKLRAFSLDVEEATFHQLETLRRILISARTGNLLLGKEAVNETVCRELVVKAGLVANLKLFEFVFQGWPGLTPATVTPPLVPPVAPSPPAPPRAVAPSPPTVASQSVPTSTPPPVAPTPSPAVPPSAPPLPEWVEVMLRKTAEYLKKKGQPVQPAGAMLGPTFVRLKMEPRGDTDFSKVRRQAENLKVHLVLEQNPLILSQPGHYSIDVQRTDRQSVSLPPLLLTCPPKFAGEPAFPVGVGVAGNVEWLNLSDSEACHLLVAGTTGSGKSEFLKSMLAGLAARLEPGQLKFRLIDPKRVTFNVAANCPYLGGPVVNDGDEALEALRECAEEMERRYLLLQQRGVDHIRHLKGPDAVARWVVVMDEFADLMVDKATKKQLEPLLKRLGAKARAAGIHLILGTQRPDASVVTPVLRANLPGKIGLQVGSERESKLFLDEPDAAYLFGKGDLVWKRGGGLVRLQSPFVPKEEFDRYLRVI